MTNASWGHFIFRNFKFEPQFIPIKPRGEAVVDKQIEYRDQQASFKQLAKELGQIKVAIKTNKINKKRKTRSDAKLRNSFRKAQNLLGQ